uniref:Erythroid differentiation-related factor 1 n=1 Tax=Ascaris suum TaxID=6253 RepID=F1KR35_ASCSU
MMSGALSKSFDQTSGALVAYKPSLLSLLLPSSNAPLPAVRLAPNTNLNVPPLRAWFDSGTSSYPSGYFGTSFRQKDCFHSLRLASKYEDCIGAVDVIAHSDTIKKLLLSPFNATQPLNMVVHRIGKTLLIDNCEYLRTTYPSSYNSSPVADFLKLKCSQRTGLTEMASNRQLATNDIITRMGERMITENLYSRSLAIMDHPTEWNSMGSLADSQTAKTSINKTPEKAGKPMTGEESGFTDPLEDYGITGFQDADKVDIEIEGRIWKFVNLKMLVDVNIPIFGCNSNPCVTIYAKDMRQRPISCLTGIDLYLDQCMCNVPEALLCWHMSGYVKEYEVIRTEDIPKLESSKFDPDILRNIAGNLVEFLQEHATKEGHTYWLSRDIGEEGGGMLRLWDLTPLCADLLEDEISNPYTLSVAVLIYKVARNLMRRSAKTRPKRIANAVYRLLHVCLAIVDRNKYPQIVACARYLLANLYLSYGHDALKRSDEEEAEIEKNEPTWAYDDKWQREYGETYEHYAAISIESLKKRSFQESNGKKPPPKLRPLPNCSSIVDCYKQALEHCYEGLLCMDMFDELEQSREHKNRMSFTGDRVKLADTCEEIGEMLRRDVRSILLIRAATAYNLLADNAFILERYGRSVRFARVGFYCCLAVKMMNKDCKRNKDDSKGKNAARNYATACSLIPVMYSQCGGALAYLAMSTTQVREQAEEDAVKCYRDAEIEKMARARLPKGADKDYGWMFPSKYTQSVNKLLHISERLYETAIGKAKKNAPLSLFPPTASAILQLPELAKRCGGVSNLLGMRAIAQLQSFLAKVAPVAPSNADTEIAKAALAQFLAVEHGVQSAVTMTTEAICRKTFAIAKNYFTQAHAMFGISGDRFNEARMLGNLGQLHYLLMNCVAVTTDSSSESLCRKERLIAVDARRYYEGAYELACANRNAGDAEFYEFICKDFGNTCCLYARVLQERMLESNDFVKVARECEDYIARAITVYGDAISWEGCREKMRCFFIRKNIEALYRCALINFRFYQIEQGSAQEVERQLLTKRALLIIDLAQRIFKQLSIEEISIRECAIAMRAYLFLHTVEGTHKNDAKTTSEFSDSLNILKQTLKPMIPYLKAFHKKTSASFFRDYYEKLVPGDDDLYGYVLSKLVDISRDTAKAACHSAVELHMETAQQWKDFYRSLLFSCNSGIYESLATVVKALVGAIEAKLF